MPSAPVYFYANSASYEYKNESTNKGLQSVPRNAKGLLDDLVFKGYRYRLQESGMCSVNVVCCKNVLCVVLPY
jgi:hypothetical protein